MSLDVAKNVLCINPSATLAMVGKIAELKKEGKEIIAFNVGEPDFDTPTHINDALIKAVEQQKTKYVSVNGIVELREAICDKLKNDNNLDYDPSQIVVTTGAKQALYNSVKTLVNEADEVILPTPCWVSYEEMVKSCGGKVVFVPTDSKTYQLDIDAIEKAITNKTKAIIINTPNNPSGAVYTKETLEKLASLAIKYDFYVIADEIYEKLVYNGAKNFSIASLNEEIYERTITINGYAKAYAMTGHRIGYVAAPLYLAKLITNLQAHMTSNSTTPVQYAAIAALTSDQNLVDEMVSEFDTRRKLSIELLKDIPHFTFNDVQGAFYIMIDVSYYFGKEYNGKIIKDADDFSMFLLEEANVALVSGISFQAPNFVRFSYSNSQDNITKGLNNIKNTVTKLK